MAQTFAANFLNLKYGNDDLVDRTTRSRARALKELWTVVQGSGGAQQEARFTLAGSGSSANTLAEAQLIDAARANGNEFKWSVPYAKLEGSINVPYDDIVASKGADDAATRAMEYAIDSGLEKFGVDLQGNLLGTPELSKGTGDFSTTGFVITLADAADAANFSHGDRIVADEASDGQTLLAQDAAVVSVDVDAGTITVGTSAGGGASAGSPGAAWTNGLTLFLFKKGVVNSSANSYDRAVVPMGAYIPSAAATSTLLGVDRSLDSRLSGMRNSTGSTKLLKIRNLIAKMANRASDVFGSDLCVVANIEDVEAIAQELSSSVQQTVTDNTQDGYIAFHILTALGRVPVIGDRKKTKGTAFVLNKRHLKLHVQGMNGSGGAGLCHLVKSDGVNVMRAKDTSNDMEVRPYSRIAHTIGAPYMHGIVTF